MPNLIEEYVFHLQEVNRIVQGLSKKSGKPKEHIDTIWKQTEKEVVLKHKYGVADSYKEIGQLVRSKLGVPKETEDEKSPKTD